MPVPFQSTSSKKNEYERRALPVISSVILHCRVLRLEICTVIVPISCTCVCHPSRDKNRGGRCGPRATQSPEPAGPTARREESIYYSGWSGLWKPGRSSSEWPCGQCGLCAGWDRRAPPSQNQQWLVFQISNALFTLYVCTSTYLIISDCYPFKKLK